MSTIALSNGSSSPFDYLGSLLGNSISNLLNRKLTKLSQELKEITEIETAHLERLNKYQDFDVKDLDTFEQVLSNYEFLEELFNTIYSFSEESISKVPKDDTLYTDLVLINNQMYELNELFKKVSSKLHYIHDRILSESSEAISSDVLKDIWEGEEELWDNFYLESQS